MLNKNSRLNFLVFFSITLFLFQSVNLNAQDKIPDSLINERIQCIQNMFNQQKTKANLWWYGWLTGYSAAVVGQTATYFLTNDIALKQDMVLGASTTLLGVLGQLFMPLDPGHKAEILSSYPESTSVERNLKLNYAEDLLKAMALREEEGKSWKAHAICGAVNITGGIITWKGFDRSIWAGVGNFAFNMAITEIQILTQPTQAINDYERYCAKYKAGYSSAIYKPKLFFYVCAYPGGIKLKVLF